MSMKLRIHAIAITLLLLAIGVPTAISVVIVEGESRQQIASLAEDERDDVRMTLKNQVDLVHQMVGNAYGEATHLDYQKQVYGRVLQGVITVLIGDIERRIALVKAGELTEDAAKAEIASIVATLRFGSDDDYVWIQTDGLPVPRMVMHPQRPDLNGVTLDSPAFDCARNQAENLFVAAVEVASAGGGFIDYLWERQLPGGARQPNIPKISYVQGVPEWGWVLGSGVFVDHAVREAIDRVKSRLGRLRYEHDTIGFWVHDARGTVVSHPDPDLVGRKDATDHALPFLAPSLAVSKSGTREGYFEFTMPDGQGQPGRHVGYARVFEPLAWTIGTSRCVRALEQQLAWREEAIRRVSRRVIGWNLVPLLLLLGLTWRLVVLLTEQLAATEPAAAATAPIRAGDGTQPGGTVAATDGSGASDESQPVGGSKGTDATTAADGTEQVRLLAAIQATLERIEQRTGGAAPTSAPPAGRAKQGGPDR